MWIDDETTATKLVKMVNAAGDETSQVYNVSSAKDVFFPIIACCLPILVLRTQPGYGGAIREGRVGL